MMKGGRGGGHGQQISYMHMTLIGVHLTIHLMHPNLILITRLYVCDAVCMHVFITPLPPPVCIITINRAPMTCFIHCDVL